MSENDHEIKVSPPEAFEIKIKAVEKIRESHKKALGELYELIEKLNEDGRMSSVSEPAVMEMTVHSDYLVKIMLAILSEIVDMNFTTMTIMSMLGEQLEIKPPLRDGDLPDVPMQ